MGMHDPNGKISAPSTYSSYLDIILSKISNLKNVDSNTKEENSNPTFERLK